MTHRLMHEHVGKRAKMQKKQRKPNMVAPSKKGKHINIAQSGERHESSTPTPRRCISQVVTSKQTLRGTNVSTQAQNHGGHNTWQSLDLEMLT